MNYKIVVTPAFQQNAKVLGKKYHSIKEDLLLFEKNLQLNPYMGIDLGGGVRKIRIAITSKNKGKRGGARIITYHFIVNMDETKIYLLSIYDKSEKDSISKQEIENIKKENGLL
ncbi:hypothetical protein Barb6_02064 [Bacteroidales bacterium Barb6]|nr:hypothetical protein Barb6_02064 [Bacteroidales bacterium Barb6]